MAEPERKRRNVLLYLAAEGVLPALGGAAGAAAEGPVGGVAGVAVGRAVEKAINLVGRGIVDRWGRWFAAHPSEAREAVAELAATPPSEARADAHSFFLELAPGADESDLAWAVEYLSAVPCAVDRALVPDPAGGRSVPPTVSLDDPRSLLQLLPEDVPPYGPGAVLAGTPYRLVELLGAGGFGAVYRAESPSLQHLPLAIKFCLDRGLVPALNQERSNLERLMRAGGRGSGHVVRLYGYDLDHTTPYLVYEYVEGGDLTKLLAARRAEGRPPAPAEVLGWVAQIADGLAFAHRAGVVHRDVKPANVLAGVRDQESGVIEPRPATGSSLTPDSCPLTPVLKLADFGLGGVGAARAAARSRIGTTTVDYLSLADQASLFRGAGTPLYMSPEQRRGMPPDPRHDLYALGVVWYQLLVGDVSRELHHGWAKELAVRFGVPAAHIGLIERCVGWFDERPKDANELLPLLREARDDPTPGPSPTRGGEEESGSVRSPLPASGRGLGGGVSDGRGEGSLSTTLLAASQITPVPVPPSGTSDGRRRGLAAALARLQGVYAELDELKGWRFNTTLRNGFLLGLLVGWLVGEFAHAVQFNTGHFPTAFRAAPFDWLSVVLGVGAGLGVWAAYVWVMRSGVHAVASGLRQKAENHAAEIAEDFPTEVAGWGGRPALRHPATVRQIKEELEPPAPAAAPAATGPSAEELAADPTRKVLLVARLREHDAALAGATDADTMTWGLGVATGGPIAAFAAGAAAYHALIEKASRGGGEYYTYNQGPAAVAAAVAGLAAFAAVWWAMVVVRRHFRRRAAASLDRLAADYPRLVDGWGGPAVLGSRETVGALVKMLDPAVAGKPGWGWVRRLFGG